MAYLDFPISDTRNVCIVQIKSTLFSSSIKLITIALDVLMEWHLLQDIFCVEKCIFWSFCAVCEIVHPPTMDITLSKDFNLKFRESLRPMICWIWHVLITQGVGYMLYYKCKFWKLVQCKDPSPITKDLLNLWKVCIWDPPPCTKLILRLPLDSLVS